MFFAPDTGELDLDFIDANGNDIKDPNETGSSAVDGAYQCDFIDGGGRCTSNQFRLDIDFGGRPRPNGAAADIGAYESNVEP